MSSSKAEYIDAFKAGDRWSREVAKDYASPGKPGYVVREFEGRREIDVMSWGFPFQGKPVTNVRNYTSPFWRSALANPARRCLVPFTAFQEWSVAPDPVTGKKRPHWFHLPASPIAAFAGVWRPAEEGEAYFSFLTCGYDGDPAAHIVGAIHPKACPVILHPEDYDRWLHTDLDDALSLATPFPSQLMAIEGQARALWHVGQTTAARLQATSQDLAAQVNDSAALEGDADRLGARQLSLNEQPLAAPIEGDNKGKPLKGG